jgi:UDP-N-acetylmuramyl pentapeptide phosphotransferase/UDP-N-acetylglucosamine-1-phosphate transferase
MLYIAVLVLFFLIMILYFRIADHYNIIDHPNERSSHTQITIRGGGVIFVFSGLMGGVLHSEYWLPVIGMVIIGFVSFIDDRITLSNRIRVIAHLVAVTLLFISLDLFHLFHWSICALFYVLVIGIINAYNFMDGINGITGLYSVVILGGLQYVNYEVDHFVNEDLIWFPLLACLVFLFFNFRKRAKCFAGDVGSISIAFFIVYLLLKLMVETGNYNYILFLAVYGVDTVLTIGHRLMLKQNIFKAHRLHFYQILANEQGLAHLWVSVLYALLQCLIIVIVIYLPIGFNYLFLVTTLPLVVCYTLFKQKLMRKSE